MALTEIRRVLRPGGVSLHLFPGPYTPLELHTLVPLATVIQSRWWLAFWARVGVRNEFQQGKSASEVTDRNSRFLASQTTYYSRRRVLREARTVFGRARLLEIDAVAAHPRPLVRCLAPVSRRASFIAVAFTELRGRALLLE